MQKSKISKMLSLSLTIIFLIIVVLFSVTNQNVKDIKLLKFENFMGIGNDLIKSYHKEKDIDAILSAIKNGKKVELNSVDFAKADYCIKISYWGYKSRGYYLILNKYKYALLIDANNTNIGFDIQKDDVDRLSDIFN